MRFDILDEYSTLVPFGLGAFEQNRVVKYPATATEPVKAGAMANCGRRVKIWVKFVKALAQRYQMCRTHAVTHAPPEIS
jgi:hypothetical protein